LHKPRGNTTKKRKNTGYESAQQVNNNVNLLKTEIEFKQYPNLWADPQTPSSTNLTPTNWKSF